jgi:7-carboxy-7-deazaguanine synthase
MKVAEIFYSLQGEVNIGRPSAFIRFTGCNLIKEKKGCRWCDTKWANTIGTDLTISEIIRRIKRYKCKHVVLTGGEVLSQDKEELLKLLKGLNLECISTELETNGTIFDGDIMGYLDCVNCSPKRQAINIEVLKQYNEYHVNFKFVYEPGKEKWWEKIIKEVNIPNNQVYIMPEGRTKNHQFGKMEEVWKYCCEKQYNMSPRLHILTFGNKKGI